MCGLSCTYTYYGANYRDTDWYEVVVAAAAVSVSPAIGEFDLQILLFYSIVDCFSYQYLAVPDARWHARLALAGDVGWRNQLALVRYLRR